MKKLSLNSLLIVCLSICLILGVYLAFDYDLGTTENVADATTTNNETWSIKRGVDNSTKYIEFDYYMEAWSSYWGDSTNPAKLYFMVWETGVTSSYIDCQTTGGSNVTAYQIDSDCRHITYRLSGDTYYDKDLSYGIFVYNSAVVNTVEMQAKPADWPNLPSGLSGGVDFTSPTASSINDTYKSTTAFVYKINETKVAQAELVHESNQSQEACSVDKSHNTKVDTLYNCFEAIKSTGGTVTLLKEINLYGSVKVGNGENNNDFILQLNYPINSYKSAAFDVMANFEVQSSSNGVIAVASSGTIFNLKQCTTFIPTLTIKNGNFLTNDSIIKTDSVNYNKINVIIEGGLFDSSSSKQKGAVVFDLNNASTCTESGNGLPTSYLYSEHKDDIDITISGGRFFAVDSIFKFGGIPETKDSYNAGRKIVITAGEFESQNYITECDYHCNFTIGCSINTYDGSYYEPKTIKFTNKVSFCNDKSATGHNVTSNTIKFYSCLVSNSLFSQQSTTSSVAYKYFTDMDWCVDLSMYKDGGFWKSYFTNYYSLFPYAIYQNFKLDYRDGNDPQIIPNKSILSANGTPIPDYNSCVELNPYKREIVNIDAPNQYFVCWSTVKDNLDNDNLINKYVGASEYSSSIYYDYDDFYKNIDGQRTLIDECFYAVWSTTDIKTCNDTDGKIENEDYSNITPVWTQTLHWGTSAASSDNGSISEFVKIYDSSYDSNVLTINENIVIDVRNKENNSLECIKISADSGTYKIVLGADLSIYLSSYIKNAELIGLYTSLGIDFSIESKDSSNHNLNIAVNNYADNNSGQTYGMRCFNTINVKSTNINLKSLNNAKYTGISVGNQKADKYLYLNNSNINFTIKGTTTLSNVTYIAVPALALEYSDNLGSQIVCNIIDSTKLSSKPCFDFTSTESIGLYSETLSPYVDNVSSKEQKLNIYKKASDDIYILCDEAKNIATTLYHFDLSKTLTISNVPKISNAGGTKKCASFSSVINSYDNINDYYLLNDYVLEDSIYKYAMNHDVNLNLNDKNLYLNNTIIVNNFSLTFYGTGNIYAGVADSNPLFTGETLGKIKVLADTSNSNNPVAISLYFGNAKIIGGEANFYVGSEYIVDSGSALIDINSSRLSENIHIMSGWMKYNILNTTLYEDGTKVIEVEESKRVNKDYSYYIVNYQSFEWNDTTYSSLNKAYKAYCNDKNKNDKEIYLKEDALLCKDCSIETYGITVNLNNYQFNLNGHYIMTDQTCFVSFVGKDSSNYGEIIGSGNMFDGDFTFKYCRIIKNDSIGYLFIGNDNQKVTLTSCDVKINEKNKFLSSSMSVELNGGFYDIKLNTSTSKIAVYNGYFVNDISSYVSHLDGVHIYTKNINENPSWDSSTTYTCKFFSEDVVNVYYASTKKTVSYLSLSAAIKAINDDNNETSYKLTLLNDAYLFQNYLTEDGNYKYINVTKDIIINTENTNKICNIYFDKYYYLVVQKSLNITNAKIYANRFFYLNDEIGDINITLNNCELIQYDSADDSDCVFNSAAIKDTSTQVTVVLNNNFNVDCTEGKFNLGQGQIDYQFIGDGKMYFNVNEFGGKVEVSTLTGNKEIYYSYDTSKDVLIPEENNYLSIGVTNKDYENNLDRKYVYKTISNPLSIINKNNYDVDWYKNNRTSFTLTTKEQLLGFAAICNGYTDDYETFDGKEIHLGADIDLTGISWLPISQFDGTFYGDNHKIYNLTIDCMTKEDFYYGLFGTYSGPSINDLEVSGTFNISSYIDSYQMLLVGGLIGYAQTNIINCSSNISITFDCPKLYKSSLTICIGGIVGNSTGTGIYNSVYTSTITTTLPSDYNTNNVYSDKIYVGILVGDLTSSQIANSYANKESIYNIFGISVDSTLYNAYSINSTSKYFDVFIDNTLKSYSNYEEVTKLLDKAIYSFDSKKLLTSGFELYYWDSKDDIPVFYDGPYFKLVVNGEVIKTCDEGFTYEPKKDRYTFEYWLRTSNDYTSIVKKNNVGEYDATCFESRTYYYAYFLALNEITELTIDDWVYGEDANKPKAKSLYGNILFEYSVKGTDVYTDTVPTDAGEYTLKAYVKKTLEYHYAVKTIDFKINKAAYDMSKIEFKNKEYVYDGTTKKITYYGFLPNDVSVSYSSDKEKVEGEECNELTTVGKINVTASFTLNNENYTFTLNNKNYNTITLCASLEIKKATIDMTSIRFEDTYYTYDDSIAEYTIKYIGTLPTGIIKVIYSSEVDGRTNTLQKDDIDETTHCGSLKVTATFSYDTNNYETVDPMTATLYVNTYETFNVSSIKLQGYTQTYKQNTYWSLVISGTLPDGVSVSYTYTKDGKELDNVASTGVTNAGTYNVVAHFTAGTEITDENTGKLVGYDVGGVRYNPMNDLVAILVINKATYNIEDILASFKDVSYEYEPNTTYSLTLSEINEKKLNDAGIGFTYSDNTLSEAGSTLAKLSFTVDEDNYNTIDAIYATLTVEKATYNLSDVIFKGNEFTYDGKFHTIKIEDKNNVLQTYGISVKYSIKEAKYRQDSDIVDDAGATTVGSLYVYAIFTGDSKNYNQIDDMYAIITIKKATYNMAGILFEDVSYVYDGKIHNIYVTDEDKNPAKLPDGVTVYYTTNTLGKAGTLEVTASFVGDSINYKPIENMYATLTITKATYDMSGISFKDVSYVYDTTSKTIVIDGTLPKGITVTYKNNKGLQVGTYEAKAIFKVDERNYNVVDPMTATLTITKATYDMSNIKFEDTALIYNGEYQTIYISGTLPIGVTVEYQHNSLKDVCPELDAVATFKILDTLNYNEIQPMRAKFVILKATYDMSNITFEDISYVYDGTSKEVVIKGTLPNGVTVTYENNQAINANKYEAKAVFSGDFNNYYGIPNMIAILEIKKATYNLSNIKFDDVSYMYDGTEKKLEIEGTLPEGVNVEYSTNFLENSGSILVIATFSIIDEVNYNEISPKSATLTIEKLTYDMSDIKFEDKTYVYDGTDKKLEITGNLPLDVQPVYSYNRMVDVGVMQVTVAFRGDTVNHNAIPQMTATLTITKATYDLQGISFEDQTILYDGQQHIIEISGTLPSGVSVQYDNNNKVDPGSYIVKAIVSGDTHNYYSKEYIATLTIQNTQLKNDESESKSIAVVLADSGFTKDVSLKTGYSTDSTTYSNLTTKDTKVLAYYSVTLYMVDETGTTVEYQPSECTVSGKITVKLLLNGIDLREVEKIYHVHKDGSVEEIAFDMSMFDGQYITLELTSLSDFVFVAHDDTYTKTMIMNIIILVVIILVGLYLINTILYIIWKKTGFALLKFMIPLYRFKNKLFFKIKFNDKEILDQDNNAGEKLDKDQKKGKTQKRPTNKNKRKNNRKKKKKK